MFPLISLIPKRNIMLCFFSAGGWVTIPLLFQWYLDKVLTDHKITGSLPQLSLLSLLLIFVFALDFYRFNEFVKNKPKHVSSQSLAAKLSQDRLWFIDIPNILSHTLIALGGLAILGLRDLQLCFMVVLWFVASQSLQLVCGKNVRATATKFHANADNEISLSLQETLLRSQVLASGLSTTLKIGGQITIYSLVFLAVVKENESALPSALANLEYVALILASLQVVSSSLPKITELKAYLSIRLQPLHAEKFNLEKSS